MTAKVLSYGLLGLEAYPVEVEVDVSGGLPSTTLVGLADAAIKESKARVKSAIKNSGFRWPEGRITISLAPSGIKKEGASFDLAIALGILAATEQIDCQTLNKYCILGELSLDGSLRPVRGSLAIALCAAKTQVKEIILPRQNALEAGIVSGILAWPQNHLRQTVEFLHSGVSSLPVKADPEELFRENAHYEIDFSEVRGQYLAKRAIEVAVSGRHNILLIGPPGSGKTMLAKRIPTIMPELNLAEALEITKIHSVMGLIPESSGIINRRPFRAPHHSASCASLVGGGSVPVPGEISLAHQGVLFLDELPEFRRDCLEALRQPLEEAQIRICRVFKSFSFPASIMMVSAMNPCPCGNLGNSQKPCSCNTTKVHNYLNKISGPLLDRIDIHIELPAIKYKELSEVKEAESSEAIKQRVKVAQSIQTARFGGSGIFYNASMNSKLIRKYCTLAEDARDLLKAAMSELGLSGRAYDKILRVARTIADLADSKNILSPHIAEAIQYRSLDRWW